MLNEYFTLPEIVMTGGDSRVQPFTLKTRSGSAFDADGYTFNFSVVSYANRNASPVIAKAMSASATEDGVISVTLDSADTVNLSGDYIYQITAKDSSHNALTLGRGRCVIVRNINKAFVTESQ